jgi:hypothetical protein
VTSSEPFKTPPGWYPDPSGWAAWRWWDGDAWTGYASTPPGPAPAAAAYAERRPGMVAGPSVHDMFADEQRSVPWAKRVAVAYPVLTVIGMASNWSQSSKVRAEFDLLRTIFRSGSSPARNQQLLALSHQSSALAIIAQLLSLVSIPMTIVLLVWQFRSAKTAQLLRMPARLVPGLGVGGWFIPVVSLWFPYLAIRDCLPPGHPGRRVVLQMWLCYLGTRFAGLVTGVLILVGTPVALPIAAVDLALATGVMLFAIRSVQTIADTHGQLLYPSQPDHLPS